MSLNLLSGDISITTIPPEPELPYHFNVDTWSLGMLLTSICLDIPQLWPGAKVWQVIRKVVSLGECESGKEYLKLGIFLDRAFNDSHHISIVL